jgi:hypothetical protein
MTELSTEEPTRWLDDPTLSASLRADLHQGATATVTGLDTTAGLAALRGAIAAQTGSMAPAAASSSSLALKAVVGVIAIGGALALWKATQEDAPASKAVAVAPASIEPNEPVAEAPRPAIPHEDAQPAVVVEEPTEEIEIDLADEEPAKRDDRSDRRKDASSDETKPVAAVEPADDKYLQEAMLVARARKALAYDAKATLELTQTIAKDFPAGQLVEERRALEIRALARLGRLDEAKARATGFLADHAKGPHAAAVRRAIGDDAE